VPALWWGSLLGLDFFLAIGQYPWMLPFPSPATCRYWGCQGTVALCRSPHTSLGGTFSPWSQSPGQSRGVPTQKDV